MLLVGIVIDGGIVCIGIVGVGLGGVVGLSFGYGVYVECVVFCWLICCCDVDIELECG